MVDVMGHPWFQLPTATPNEFKQAYYTVISDMTNYPTYSVDFDRAQAKEALRGDDGEEDENNYDEIFKFDIWENVPFNEFDPETASKHRIVTQHNVPTEIWELVYRLAKKSGGFVDPELVENQWKMIFYPKPDQKAKPVQGDTGAAVEEEKKDQEEEEDIDLTESVKVQAQLLKVAGTQD